MDAPNGIIDKLFKIGRHFSTAAAYDVVNSVRTSKSKVTDAATDMITSPAFQRSMQKFIDGQKQEANTMLGSLGSTKFWMSKQSDETRRLIVRHGLIQYLSGEEE